LKVPSIARMQRLAVLLIIAALCLSGADKPKGRKLPDIVVLELKVRREEGKVTLDGRVRNGGERTLEGVAILLDFLAPGSVIVTTQKASLDDGVFEPGKESGFRAVMVDPVRAVECVLTGAEDQTGRELRLAKKVRAVIE